MIRRLAPIEIASMPAARRRGLIAVIMMVGLLIASMIATTMVRATAARYRLVQREAQRLQAAWLAESGLERAAARLLAEPGYVGETWPIPADDFAGRAGGRVEIQVDSVEERPRRRRVTATGRFPAGSGSPARVTKTIIVDLSSDFTQDTNP